MQEGVAPCESILACQLLLPRPHCLAAGWGSCGCGSLCAGAPQQALHHPHVLHPISSIPVSTIPMSTVLVCQVRGDLVPWLCYCHRSCHEEPCARGGTRGLAAPLLSLSYRKPLVWNAAAEWFPRHPCSPPVSLEWRYSWRERLELRAEVPALGGQLISAKPRVTFGLSVGFPGRPSAATGSA